MATITLTPTACTSPEGWVVLYNYLTTNSSYYPRQFIFTYPASAVLGGAGVNITKVTVHGYVRNSNSAIKRLRLGFRPSDTSGAAEWASIGNESVLDQTFTAIEGHSGSGFSYAEIAREFGGSSIIAKWIGQQFSAGQPIYLGVIQPDSGRSIGVDVTLSRWTIEVEYELLGNIPTVDKSSAKLGETIRTTVNRVIEGSETTLVYKIGDQVLKTVDLGTSTGDSYTVPTGAGAYFPNDLIARLTIEAATVKDGTDYGSISTSVVLTLPDDAAPDVSGGTIRCWADGIPAAGRLGAYVQSKSGVQFSGQILPAYGAAAGGLTFEIEGSVYSAESGGELKHLSISGSGEIPWKATVTDSRGLSRTKTGAISALPYSAPSIQAFSVSRANASGARAIDGTYAFVSLQASVSSLVVSGEEKNALSFAVQYRKMGTTDWTVCDTVTGSGVSGTFSGLLMKDGAAVDDFDDLSGYSFRAVVSDIYGSSVAQDEMPTKEQIWDIDESTGSMGFGGDAPLSTDDAGYRFYRFVDFSAGYKKYSEDEIDTGNVWIDGKPIYRACVSTTTSLSNAIGTVATLPSAVQTPISLNAFVKFPGDGGWRSVPTSYHGSLNWSVLVYIAGNEVNMGFGSAWAGEKQVVVIAEYTKEE